MNRIILLNGPAKVGKDDLITHLSKSYKLTRAECKEHLHNLTALFFAVPKKVYWELYNSRETKEKPQPIYRLTGVEYIELCDYLGKPIPTTRARFHFLTPREAMIYVSELICKPAFGEDYFGRVRTQNLAKGNLFVDGSAAFDEEIPSLHTKFDPENILLIKIRRPGYGFDGDSRGWVTTSLVKNTVAIDNNKSLDEFLVLGGAVVSRFIAGERGEQLCAGLPGAIYLGK